MSSCGAGGKGSSSATAAPTFFRPRDPREFSRLLFPGLLALRGTISFRCFLLAAELAALSSADPVDVDPGAQPWGCGWLIMWKLDDLPVCSLTHSRAFQYVFLRYVQLGMLSS